MLINLGLGLLWSVDLFLLLGEELGEYLLLLCDVRLNVFHFVDKVVLLILILIGVLLVLLLFRFDGLGQSLRLVFKSFLRLLFALFYRERRLCIWLEKV